MMASDDMTDSGGEEHDDNDGEPTSTNGAIANGGNRAGGGGGGRCGGGRDFDNISREEVGMRWGMRWFVLPLHQQPKVVFLRPTLW